ncbi:ion channel [Pseudopontixanthobacter vadosimaris]|uniref:ion channel n=1 Tax=Pseudopontixanthobacter vadosimaris TaxID=2726450 RepID=UPI001472761D|nr:ion channel [Pseudopontixanthobacter vadosimaris]
MTMYFRLFLAILLFCIGQLPGQAIAAQTVQIAEVPPYALKDGSGGWSGPAVDLFRAAAQNAGVAYRFVEVRPSELATSPAMAAFPAYADGGARKAGTAGTAHSLPFYTDSVGLIGGAQATGFVEGLANLANWGFLKVVLIVSGLIFVAGALFWLVERRGNESVQGSEDHLQHLGGIGNGFWWAGVTATTIGYGDIVPKTKGGRVVAMVWMLFSMALTAILTAYLVSLTGKPGGNTNLSSAIEGQHVGVVAGEVVQPAELGSAERVSRFASIWEALQALDADRIDLVAYPAAQARAVAGDRTVQETGGSVVFPVFRFAEDTALSREIDRIILTPAWQSRAQQAFGKD